MSKSQEHEGQAEMEVLSRSNFMHVLELEVEAGRSKDYFDVLWQRLREYALGDFGAEPIDPAQASSGLGLQLGGIHVRLTKTTKEELALIALALGLVSAEELKVAATTLAALIALKERVRPLRTDSGDRCVVAAIRETHPTTEYVADHLHGAACRFPGAKCQFHDGSANTCGVRERDVEVIVERLERWKVVQAENAVPPRRWSVTI